MTAILKTAIDTTVFQEIVEHSAWIGEISGLSAEKMLRGKQVPFLYLLRAGEKSKKANEENYYVTFVASDLSVRHQPIVVAERAGDRFFENGGCFIAKSIDDVMHLMLHCEKGQCVPFQQ